MKKLILTAALFLFSESAAYADGLCGANLSDDDLVGNYTINLGLGTLTVITDNGGHRVYPVPLKTGTATISIHDGVPIGHFCCLASKRCAKKTVGTHFIANSNHPT